MIFADGVVCREIADRRNGLTCADARAQIQRQMRAVDGERVVVGGVRRVRDLRPVARGGRERRAASRKV